MKLKKLSPSFMGVNPRIQKLLIPLIILSSIFAVIHFFIFQVATLSLLDEKYNFLRNILAVILAAGVFVMPIGYMVTLTPFKKKLMALTWINYIWMGTFHLLFHFSLLEFLAQMIWPHPYSYWTLIASVVIGAWALYKGLKFPKIKNYILEAPSFLAGQKLVQISDLHVGMLHLNQKWLAKIVEKINHLQPEFVAITGDLVEGPYPEVSPQLEPLKNLNANSKKFYITGNHEYIHQSGPWENRLEQLGFRSLHNSSEIISYGEHKLQMAGIPDRMAPRFNSTITSNPDRALFTTEKVDYRILLAHEPSSVFDLKNETCDVILSGHTHGGQIFPFYFYVRALQPVVKGFKVIRNILVFAHEGTGFWGPPMRWLSESEIAVFEFVTKK